MTEKEMQKKGFDVYWVGGVGWCGPDFKKAQAYESEQAKIAGLSLQDWRWEQARARNVNRAR